MTIPLYALDVGATFTVFGATFRVVTHLGSIDTLAREILPDGGMGTVEAFGQGTEVTAL